MSTNHRFNPTVIFPQDDAAVVRYTDTNAKIKDITFNSDKAAREFAEALAEEDTYNDNRAIRMGMIMDDVNATDWELDDD